MIKWSERHLAADGSIERARRLSAWYAQTQKLPYEPSYALTELVKGFRVLDVQHQAAMKVVDAIREWRQSLEADGWEKQAIEDDGVRPGIGKGFKALVAFDKLTEDT